MKQQPDQNMLAYMLADELQKATAKFCRKCPAININGILGAANVFIASWFTHAPSKEIALQDVEQCVDIIRDAIAATPDAFFGKGAMRPNLN